MIVTLADSSRSLIFAVLAKSPAIEYALSVFRDLVQESFPQCIYLFQLGLTNNRDLFKYSGSTNDVLCPVCLEHCFHHSTRPLQNLGAVRGQVCDLFSVVKKYIYYFRYARKCMN